MIQQKKPMEIIRENGIYRCVKLNRKYYCVSYDADENKTRAIIPHDRVVGEFRTFEGYSHAAVDYVAKGRKRETAIAYFNAFLRSVRYQAKLRAERQKENDINSAHAICGWCNGSGIDSRNIEWSCTKC